MSALIAVVMTAIVLVLLAARNETRRKGKLLLALEHLARQRGGLLLPASHVPDAYAAATEHTVEQARMRIFHIAETGKDGSDYTIAQVQLPRFPLPRVEIYPQKALHAIAKLFGMEDLEVGDLLFDEAFILKSSHAAWLRGFLSDRVRTKIRVLADELPGELYIHIQPGSLLVRKESLIADPQRLARLHDETAALVQELLRQFGGTTGTARAARAAIEVADTGAAPPPDARSQCLVCGQLLRERPVVRCRRCETAHHQDCWEYNGRCAVYGCPEVRWG
jgi:hypothetical protein